MSSDRWFARARCRGVENLDHFFPFEENKNGDRRYDDRILTQEAKELCVDCDVQWECLSYAIDNKINEGVYGGLTPTQRRTFWRRLTQSTGAIRTNPEKVREVIQTMTA